VDRNVMVVTRWIRLATLIAFIILLLFLKSAIGYLFIVVCLAFLGLTAWQLWKLYTDEKYLE
jgi:predicted negative regulator of RcsB-dependent stress response